jgi:hypothetical protein
MRNTNNRNFCVATRAMLCEINSDLTLNLILGGQSIFRATQTNLSDIARTVQPQAIRLP